jgi:hypothetical protein
MADYDLDVVPCLARIVEVAVDGIEDKLPAVAAA